MQQRSARAGRPAGRAGPGPGLEIIVFKRAGPGLNADGPGRARDSREITEFQVQKIRFKACIWVKIPYQKLFLKDQMKSLPTKIELTAYLAVTFQNITISGNIMLRTDKTDSKFEL